MSTLPPAMIMKSDGATLYITRDIATAIYRARTYNCEKKHLCCRSEQSTTPSVESSYWRKWGFDWSDDWFRSTFGLVTKTAKKLSTRKGNIILLEPTLQSHLSCQSADRRKRILNWKTKEEVAHAVGVGAVKFYDLKTDRRKGMTSTSREAMVSFEGETGPYVQYAYARIQSIFMQSQLHTIYRCDIQLERSWKLGNHQASPRLLSCCQNVPLKTMIHPLIAKYAINLPQAFNKYYAHTRILDESPERESPSCS